MLNTVYQLKSPRRFEAVFKEVPLDCGQVIVRPTHLSICNADQRYYQGTRKKEVLKKKLPMALIHEGIGKVVYDPTGTFQVGCRVVMIPNIPVEECDTIGENYLHTSRFCGSGHDGFLREFVAMPPRQLVPVPEGLNPSVAAFTELVSVSYHSITRFLRSANSRRGKIGVWGDGNLAYITSLLLKKMLPDSQVIVFGKHRSKLSDFTFADELYEITELPEGLQIDHAFECVGGTGSCQAVEQIVGSIIPEGTISLLGVSEEPVPVNTRMILEKGLTVKGSSRSGRSDYEGVLSLYQSYPDITDYLENIVGAQIRVREIGDIAEAFETDISKVSGKTIMIWDK